MKKYTIFKEPLLLTQEETGMLLGITRTQWIMYSSGQRGLPARTRLKFEKLLQNTKDAFLAKPQKLAKVVAQESAIKKELETLLQDNAFKQLQLERKLAKMEAQFEAALNTLHFVHHNQNNGESASLFQLLEIRANRVLDQNTLALQEVHKIKLAVLNHEKKLLEKKLHKLL